jgi:tetratricopeptide (TPR) repeat protein
MKALISKTMLVFSFVNLCACVKRAPVGEQKIPTHADKAQIITMEPLHIGVAPDPELGLTDYDALSLFSEGLRFQEAKDVQTALNFYRRILKEFPESQLAWAAAYHAGRCLEQSNQIDAAILQYRFITQKTPRPNNDKNIHWVNAMFRLSACLRQNGQDKMAIRELDRLISLGFLLPDDLMEAHNLQAEARVKTGDLLLAEQGFRRVITVFRRHQKDVFLEPEPAARAAFRLAELAKTRFLTAPLRLPESRMQSDLETKAKLLLSAQNGFLRCMRFRDPPWAAEAGLQIGRLYVKLHQSIAQAQTPDDLNEHEIQVYRELLNQRTAVLLHKALKVFELTLQLAERTGLDTQWTAETRAEMAHVEQEVVNLLPTAQ